MPSNKKKKEKKEERKISFWHILSRIRWSSKYFHSFGHAFPNSIKMNVSHSLCSMTVPRHRKIRAQGRRINNIKPWLALMKQLSIELPRAGRVPCTYFFNQYFINDYLFRSKQTWTCLKTKIIMYGPTDNVHTVLLMPWRNLTVLIYY